MAFLTAASPCALAIGTPAAVLCGIARAARVGVLVKGGGYLELLGRIRAIAFDKTGTLTVGRPALTDVLPLDGRGEADLLALAAAIESEITHPLAEAIVHAARDRDLRWPRATEVRQLAGFGAVGRIESGGNAGAVGVGRPERDGHALAEDVAQQIAVLRRAGKTVVLVTRDEVPVGLLALRDEPRPDCRAMLDRLRGLGISHVAMLTGDHPAAAAAIAAELGVDGCHAGLMPEQKVREVAALMQRYGRVAMVGDGVNDAPALAHASLGIAMGAAGADVAMETADVVLMGSDLNRLPEAVSLSRFSRRIIAQNLAIALGVIAVVSPLAAAGFVHLGLAVLLHEGSTVVVVLNALRILRHRA
jgi:Cd2+/Zn2+-exporting ATPase